jgi:hypothetical protein
MGTYSAVIGNMFYILHIPRHFAGGFEYLQAKIFFSTF